MKYAAFARALWPRSPAHSRSLCSTRPPRPLRTMHFKVDVDRSTVSASVAEPAALIRGNAVGTFRIIDGAVSVDPANISGTGKVRMLIDATSYRSDNPSRDRSVTEKSLEADKYPTIGFESNSVVGTVITNPHEGTAIVTGFLTLHGEAHAMTMTVHATLGADGVFAGDGEVTFNYEDFGVEGAGRSVSHDSRRRRSHRSLSYHRGQRRRACAVIRLSARRVHQLQA